MSKPESTRKKRRQCPLSLHRTGQWYKKIRGKFYYFGRDKKAALATYYRQSSNLHAREGAGGSSPGTDDRLTIATMCNLYLDHLDTRVKAGEIGPPHFYGQTNRLRAFAKFVGANRRVVEVSTMDLQTYRAQLVTDGYKRNTINNHLATIKALYHWAEDNEVITKIPRLRAIKKVPPPKRRDRATAAENGEARYLFTPDQIRLLLEHAHVQMRAMIWLGLNCGFGCTDVAELRWADVDLENGKVDLPRGKTGVARNPSLWSETIAALKEVPHRGQLVFYTKAGNPWVRINPKTRRPIDTVSKEFGRLIDHVGLRVPTGTNFYTLRRLAGTQAAKTGNPYAVQGLLSHKDTRMASTYIQEVREQTDEAVERVHDWIRPAQP